jgi:hypothetical protein
MAGLAMNVAGSVAHAEMVSVVQITDIARTDRVRGDEPRGIRRASEGN